MAIELLITSILRTFVEVALLCLLGQGVVGFLAGAARERNPIYRFFCIITRPPIRALRLVMPRLVIDKHDRGAGRRRGGASELTRRSPPY